MANMNIRPYFDDYDESKGYYRILFRPSYSLQARELTQLQTIGQNQISRIGDTILDDGDSLDYGEIRYDNGVVVVTEGVFYINGFAVRVETSTIGGTGSDAISNARVGFLVTEEYVEAGDDESLYDNSNGSANYRAPGAHRYKIGLVLASRDIASGTSDLTEDFVEIFRVIDSVVYKSDSFLDSIVTEQKYNEREGENYITDNFDLELLVSNTDYSVKLSNGSAVINGREIDIEVPVSVSSNLPQDEDNDVVLIEDSVVGGVVGGFVTIDSSKVDVNTLKDLLAIMTVDILDGSPLGDPTVNLRDTNDDSLGMAKVSKIVPYSGVGISGFNVYLYNVECSDKSLVTKIVYRNSTLFSSLSGLDINFSDLSVFKLPENYITNIDTVSFSGLRGIKSDLIQAEGSNWFLELTFSGGTREINKTTVVVTNGTIIVHINESDISVITSGYKLSNITGAVANEQWWILYDEIQTDKSNASNDLIKRTLNSETISLAADARYGTLGLNYSLVVNFSVMEKDGDNYSKDISHRYVLDDGQRDSVLKLGSLSLDVGYSNPDNDIQVSYTYWSDDVAGWYATVYSYTGDYNLIPTYTTSNGQELKLSDCVDVRRLSDSSVKKVTSSDDIIAKEILIYGSRTDVVSLDNFGNVFITEGTIYQREEIISDSYKPLDLYNIKISPYGQDVEYRRINNKKVSNTELLSIEERLSELETSNSISELEQDALISESGSVINGLVTDPFIGSNIVDTENSLYTASIDYIDNYLRPSYSTSNVDILNSNGISTLNKVDDISDIHHLRGYDVINLADNISSTYYGFMKIVSDYKPFFSDDTVLYQNKNNLFDNIKNKKKNSMWKDWENSWYGSKVSTSSSLDFQSVGNRSIIQNYRRIVEDSGNINLFIDGISPTDTAPDLYVDGEIISDSMTLEDDGTGYFLDLNKIVSGRKFVELKGDNSYVGMYLHSNGYDLDDLQWSTLENSVSQEFTVYVDTIYTKLDLYFSEVNSNSVYVQIRKMVNGKPSNLVIETKILDTVTVGLNSILFDNWVSLLPGSYCITVYSPNENVGLLHSVDYPNNIGSLFKGQTRLKNKTLKFNLYRASFSTNTKTVEFDTRYIDRPASLETVASMHSSVKIISHGHGYSAGDSVIFSLIESGRELRKITWEQIQNISGSNGLIVGLPAMVVSESTITNFQVGNDMPAGDTLGQVLEVNIPEKYVIVAVRKGEWAAPHAVVFGLPAGDILCQLVVHNNTTIGSHFNGIRSDKLISTNIIKYADENSFILDDVGYTDVNSVISDFGNIVNSKINIDGLYLKAKQLVPNNCSLKWYLNDHPVSANNTSFLSNSIRSSTSSLKLEMTSDSERYSPIVYNDSIESLFISNSLDSTTVAATGTYADFYYVDNNTTSTYISKKFSLASTANALKVKFDAIIPSGNHIMVYGKFDNSSEWELLNTPNILRTGDYESLVYDIGKSFNSTTIKILLKGTNTNNVPTVKNLKVIATSGSTVVATSSTVSNEIPNTSTSTDTPTAEETTAATSAQVSNSVTYTNTSLYGFTLDLGYEVSHPSYSNDELTYTITEITTVAGRGLFFQMSDIAVTLENQNGRYYDYRPSNTIGINGGNSTTAYTIKYKVKTPEQIESDVVTVNINDVVALTDLTPEIGTFDTEYSLITGQEQNFTVNATAVGSILGSDLRMNIEQIGSGHDGFKLSPYNGDNLTISSDLEPSYYSGSSASWSIKFDSGNLDNSSENPLLFKYKIFVESSPTHETEEQTIEFVVDSPADTTTTLTPPSFHPIDLMINLDTNTTGIIEQNISEFVTIPNQASQFTAGVVPIDEIDVTFYSEPLLSNSYVYDSPVSSHGVMVWFKKDDSNAHDLTGKIEISGLKKDIDKLGTYTGISVGYTYPTEKTEAGEYINPTTVTKNITFKTGSSLKWVFSTANENQIADPVVLSSKVDEVGNYPYLLDIVEGGTGWGFYITNNAASEYDSDGTFSVDINPAGTGKYFIKPSMNDLAKYRFVDMATFTDNSHDDVIALFTWDTTIKVKQNWIASQDFTYTTNLFRTNDAPVAETGDALKKTIDFDPVQIMYTPQKCNVTQFFVESTLEEKLTDGSHPEADRKGFWEPNTVFTFTPTGLLEYESGPNPFSNYPTDTYSADAVAEHWSIFITPDEPNMLKILRYGTTVVSEIPPFSLIGNLTVVQSPNST